MGSDGGSRGWKGVRKGTKECSDLWVLKKAKEMILSQVL
jgi:hypothetical protein